MTNPERPFPMRKFMITTGVVLGLAAFIATPASAALGIKASTTAKQAGKCLMAVGSTKVLMESGKQEIPDLFNQVEETWMMFIKSHDQAYKDAAIASAGEAGDLYANLSQKEGDAITPVLKTDMKACLDYLVE